jgi:pimeloyl-ACP methyl ester carboxylesterase
VSEQPTDHTPGANPLTRVDAGIVGLRLGFRILGPLLPGRAARLAEELFTRPPHHPLRPAEEAFLATGAQFSVPLDGQKLACWSWGDGPVVLVMHGWGSRAGRFRHFIPALRQLGFRIVALDGPGHGRTGGDSASLPQFAAAVASVADAVGPVRAFIGHSLGGAAILFAMSRSVPPAPTVLIAAPSDPAIYWRRFVRHLHIPPSVRRRLQHRLQERFGLQWSDLDLLPAAAVLPTPLLVIHAEGDQDVPPDNGRALAAAAAQGSLVLTTGLGHRAIMRSPEVVRLAVEFLAQQVPR